MTKCWKLSWYQLCRQTGSTGVCRYKWISKQSQRSFYKQHFNNQLLRPCHTTTLMAKSSDNKGATKYVQLISLGKLAAISQIFSDAFSLMKSFVFWLKFHCSCPKGQIDNNNGLVPLLILYVPRFYFKKNKDAFTFLSLLCAENITRTLNPSSWKTRNRLPHIINIKAVDNLHYIDIRLP